MIERISFEINKRNEINAGNDGKEKRRTLCDARVFAKF